MLATYRRQIAAASLVAFLAAIVAANWLTAHTGDAHHTIPVGFGLRATAGTYAAGLMFALRDLIHTTAGRRAVFGAIIAGAILSGTAAGPALATASGVAFLLSEFADWLVYAPLIERGRWRAALVLSNTVGAVIDSAVFLHLAGIPLSQMPGQMLAKTTVTLVTLGVLEGGRRVVLRHRLNTARA